LQLPRARTRLSSGRPTSSNFGRRVHIQTHRKTNVHRTRIVNEHEHTHCERTRAYMEGPYQRSFRPTPIREAFPRIASLSVTLTSLRLVIPDECRAAFCDALFRSARVLTGTGRTPNRAPLLSHVCTVTDPRGLSAGDGQAASSEGLREWRAEQVLAMLRQTEFHEIGTRMSAARLQLQPRMARPCVCADPVS
jgi:hypothetical protein